jgi:endonuclease/exonuclease/phosphatase (EEP) superfamily protein YafD
VTVARDTATLRVATLDVYGLHGGAEAAATLLRPFRPDVVLLQGAPWRLRWRTPVASLANAAGLFVGAGGGPALGNVVLVSARAIVSSSFDLRYPLVAGRRLRGAVLARCHIGEASLVVASTQLAPDPAERAAQADVLAQALAAQSGPVLLAGRLDTRTDGAAWARLAEGRSDAAGNRGPRDSEGRPRPGEGQSLPRHGSILVGPEILVSGYLEGAAGVAGFAPVVVDVTIPADPH